MYTHNSGARRGTRFNTVTQIHRSAREKWFSANSLDPRFSPYFLFARRSLWISPLVDDPYCYYRYVFDYNFIDYVQRAYFFNYYYHNTTKSFEYFIAYNTALNKHALYIIIVIIPFVLYIYIMCILHCY